jgi:hypothetical protein
MSRLVLITPNQIQTSFGNYIAFTFSIQANKAHVHQISTNLGAGKCGTLSTFEFDVWEGVSANDIGWRAAIGIRKNLENSIFSAFNVGRDATHSSAHRNSLVKRHPTNADTECQPR